MLGLEALTTRVQPAETVTAVAADPTDDRILECAVAEGAECIVSGDRHLLSLGEFRIKIVKVADFIGRSPLAIDRLAATASLTGRSRIATVSS